MLFANLSSQVFDIKQLKYSLRQSFTDKNKSANRNVAVALESLAASLGQHAEQSDIEACHEYLCLESVGSYKKKYKYLLKG